MAEGAVSSMPNEGKHLSICFLSQFPCCFTFNGFSYKNSHTCVKTNSSKRFMIKTSRSALPFQLPPENLLQLSSLVSCQTSLVVERLKIHLPMQGTRV